MKEEVIYNDLRHAVAAGPTIYFNNSCFRCLRRLQLVTTWKKILWMVGLLSGKKWDNLCSHAHTKKAANSTLQYWSWVWWKGKSGPEQFKQWVVLNSSHWTFPGLASSNPPDPRSLAPLRSLHTLCTLELFHYHRSTRHHLESLAPRAPQCTGSLFTRIVWRGWVTQPGNLKESITSRRWEGGKHFPFLSLMDCPRAWFLCIGCLETSQMAGQLHSRFTCWVSSLYHSSQLRNTHLSLLPNLPLLISSSPLSHCSGIKLSNH